MTDPKRLDPIVSRREFVAGATALGAVWLLACSREQAAVADSAAMPAMPGEAAAPPQTLLHFSAEQATEIEAIASRIIPSDDGPGAREAGALYFIDRTLTTFASDQVPLFAQGLEALSNAVVKKHGGGKRFSMLTPEQQDAALKSIEQTPFFGAMRFATIAGFLALPKYGGNKDYAGWKYLGQEHAFEQKAPFGWYDLPANQQALLGRVL